VKDLLTRPDEFLTNNLGRFFWATQAFFRDGCDGAAYNGRTQAIEAAKAAWRGRRTRRLRSVA
jgi:hypothetical protein